MRNIFCYLGALVLAITLCSCSVEETHIKEGSEVAQTTESSNSFTTTVHTTLSAPTKSKTVPHKVPTPTLDSTKKAEPPKTAAPIISTTRAYTTSATPVLPTETVPVLTKPVLTDGIREQIVMQFVQKHNAEIQRIETQHTAALDTIQKEESAFSVNYAVRLRQINEKYANLGLTNSGAHLAELQALENQRNSFSLRIKSENERYEEEKGGLLQTIAEEIQAYIDANYIVP